MSSAVPPKARSRVWHKLALVLALIGVLPLILAAYLIAGSDAQRLADSARAYHLATAEVALGEARGLVARALAETRSLVQVLASDVPIERREVLARAELLGAELLDDVAVYDLQGARVLVMRTSQDATPWQPPASLDAARMQQALERGHLLGDVVQSPRGHMLLELVVPGWRGPDQTPYAFLVVAIDLSPLSTLVADLGRRHFDDVNRVRLIDNDLRVIASVEPVALGTSLRGTDVVAGVTGARPFDRNVAYTVDYLAGETNLIGAVVPMPELGWAALVEQTQDEAYAGVAATWRTAAVVAVAVALLALLIGLVLGRRFARPIEAMAEATGRVAAGDFSARVPVDRRDEIGTTAVAFNRMAADLGTYRDRLIDETRARENLSRFMSSEVVDRIVKGRAALTLGGERREITVMFADVVGFTMLADEREPEVAVAILNEFFTIVTEIVFQHGGIIDKFIGDCAMAIWGAPESRVDDARQAVRAAEAIVRWLEVGNARWHKQIGRDIEVAIGIHSGPAVVGNIGSEKRMDYTAIGDAVNRAARLERLARPGQILMTRETLQLIGDEFQSHSIGTFDIIGHARPSEIFALAE